MQINGLTEIIAHIGFPTHTFKSPMIYNPYFKQANINAVVVPMACESGDYPDFLRSIFKLKNTRGALITMPHKVVSITLVDEVSTTAAIAGACNAVKKLANGKLLGDMFDGEGFVRGVLRKGLILENSTALVVGSGGVGSAIAASLAAAGTGTLALFDINADTSKRLGERLQKHYPALTVVLGSNDPKGFDLVVNATPMGMNEGDPLPIDVARLESTTFVGEVVMREETTAFLAAAQQRGCRIQIGTDMLFEQIPAYLEYFGLPTTTAENLRAVSQLSYDS